MANLHIIWKYRKLISFLILATGNSYSAECKKINDGVYVQDLSFEGLKDGGKASRRTPGSGFALTYFNSGLVLQCINAIRYLPLFLLKSG